MENPAAYPSQARHPVTKIKVEWKPKPAKLPELRAKQKREDRLARLRAQGPKVVPEKPKVAARKPKRSLYESQLRAAEKAALRPPAVKATPTHKKRRARAVRRQERYTDKHVVQDALRVLFKDNAKLEAMLCGVSLAEAKRLLRTDKTILKLADELRGQLATPSQTYNLLDSAIKVLLPKYQQVQFEAEQETQAAAQARREEQKATASELAQKRQEKERERLKKEEHNNFWDQKMLNRA